MLYQLPTGKTIEISTEQYLDMSDAELDSLLANDAGEAINDPFHKSTLERSYLDEMSDAEYEELIEDHISEIPDADIYEKINDIDLEDGIFGE